MKIQLTISLLVSDRIETLGRCLSSLKPLLRELDSELIVVYTGKEPETRKLAEQYTSHIIPFSWCNDFSKARNAGLNEAKGEWFLYLDDDEWFEDTEELIQFFKSGEYRQYQSADYIQRNYLDWEGISYSDAYVGRMCRRFQETRFVYPIHENLKPFPEPCKRFQAFVHHFGYIGKKDEEVQEEKSDRNLSLLIERLEAEPPSAHLYAQLAQEYAAIREYDAAIRYCREGLELALKEDRRDSLEMWLQLELPRLISGNGDLKGALEEGESILSSPRLEEVGELNLAVMLVNFCWDLKEYERGLKYVLLYRKRLKYLRRHPEKADTQNGITVTFAGAERQAAELYIKGLFFSSETGDYEITEKILSWIPWEDRVQMSAVYRSLEEWKKQYKAKEEEILGSYSRLTSDNVYVSLQKAYDAERQGRMPEAERFWKVCAKECPDGFQEQLIRMAVKNGFSLKVLLEKMSPEAWVYCTQMLAEQLELPEQAGFYERILPELSEYPLFRERLNQCFLEKQLTRGMLEPSHLVALFSDYCESVIADAKMLYRGEVLEDPDSYLLPVKYKFAIIIKDALLLIEAGKFAECVPLLTKALHIYPQMSVAVSHLTRYLNERIKNPPQTVSEEFYALGGQVKQMLAGLMGGGQWEEAYGVTARLMPLLPEDMEILRLKQEILRSGS